MACVIKQLPGQKHKYVTDWAMPRIAKSLVMPKLFNVPISPYLFFDFLSMSSCSKGSIWEGMIGEEIRDLGRWGPDFCLRPSIKQEEHCKSSQFISGTSLSHVGLSFVGLQIKNQNYLAGNHYLDQVGRSGQHATRWFTRISIHGIDVIRCESGWRHSLGLLWRTFTQIAPLYYCDFTTNCNDDCSLT